MKLESILLCSRQSVENTEVYTYKSPIGIYRSTYLDVEEKAFHGVGEGIAEFDQGDEYHHTDKRISYYCESSRRAIARHLLWCCT